MRSVYNMFYKYDNKRGLKQAANKFVIKSQDISSDKSKQQYTTVCYR